MVKSYQHKASRVRTAPGLSNFYLPNMCAVYLFDIVYRKYLPRFQLLCNSFFIMTYTVFDIRSSRKKENDILGSSFPIHKHLLPVPVFLLLLPLRHILLICFNIWSEEWKATQRKKKKMLIAYNMYAVVWYV